MDKVESFFGQQALDRLNIQDVVNLYKTGDEGRHLDGGYALQRNPLLTHRIPGSTEHGLSQVQSRARDEQRESTLLSSSDPNLASDLRFLISELRLRALPICVCFVSVLGFVLKNLKSPWLGFSKSKHNVWVFSLFLRFGIDKLVLVFEMRTE